MKQFPQLRILDVYEDGYAIALVTERSGTRHRWVLGPQWLEDIADLIEKNIEKQRPDKNLFKFTH